MEVKITTLIENQPDENGQLIHEHGLSLWIEADGKKILFDTGRTGDFLTNAEFLGINTNEADYLLISHGHWDHCGGVPRLLPTLTNQISMYVGDGFFEPKYKRLEDGSFRANGKQFEEEDLGNKVHLHKVSEDMTWLTDHIIIFRNYVRSNDFEKRNTIFYRTDAHLPDDFVDEISLGIVTSKGLIVVVGCSHIGVCNILHTIASRVDMPIYMVLGGTHLMVADEVRIHHTIEYLQQMKIERVAVSHCTGEEGQKLLQKAFGTKYEVNNTGHRIIV